MKRYGIAVVGALLLAAGALVHADETSTLTIQPSEMKDGETKTFTDDGRTITVRREGNTTHVRIDEADKTEKLTITREGNRIRIGRSDGNGFRSLLVGPERRRIVIDGVPIPEFDTLPKHRQLPSRKATTWFVCPKDQTMMRVPEDKADQTYKCPVDGTTMERRKGRGFTFFLDDDTLSNML